MGLSGLTDKVAVVTGGGSGMGAAAARRLSQEGAKVVVVDWNDAGAADVVAGLSGEGLAFRADVSLEADVDAYMDAAVDRFGSVELVFLNAGISGPFGPIVDITADEYDHVIAVNQRSIFLGLRAALRRFLAQGGGGSIVTTSSIAGLYGGVSLTPYTASKHAGIGLMRCAAVQGAPDGIRVNAIAPGVIETPLLGDFAAAVGGEDVARRFVKAAVPLGRMGTPENIAALVVFLLSDEAAYLNGIVVPIDGGSSAENPLSPPTPEGRQSY